MIFVCAVFMKIDRVNYIKYFSIWNRECSKSGISFVIFTFLEFNKVLLLEGIFFRFLGEVCLGRD